MISEYLSVHPCVDCGEDDPIVLEFDHVMGIKSFSICVGKRHQYPVARLLEEIAKCEVRCANCHKRRTAQQFDWRKFRHRKQTASAPAATR